MARRSPYIVSPIYDWVFFLGPPMAAFWLGVVISGTWLRTDNFLFLHNEVAPAGLFLTVLIHAHLFAVLFRSHGNPDIFKLHPNRFVVVPLVLYFTMMWSLWVLVTVSVVATFWDVYHSASQTFGFDVSTTRARATSPEWEDDSTSG